MAYINNSALPVVREIPLEEIEGEAGCALREHLLNGERVHPMNEKQLRNRLSSNALSERNRENHCFAVYGPGQTLPSAVVYVKLIKLRKQQAEGAREKILDLLKRLGVKEVDDNKLPGDITHTLYGLNDQLTDPDTAIFYSISSYKELRISSKLMNSMGAGEYLIKKVATERLKDRHLSTFSTLSPLRQYSIIEEPSTDEMDEMRAVVEAWKDNDIDMKSLGFVGEERAGFRPWLENKLGSETRPETLFTKGERHTIDTLAEELGYNRLPQPDLLAPRKAFSDKFLYVTNHQLRLAPRRMKELHSIIRSLALEYLITTPNSAARNEIDPVENFHLGNGAMIGNIHVESPAGTSAREWESAFGVMVNYRYDLEKAADRKTQFKSKSPQRVPASTSLMAEYLSRKKRLDLENITGFAQRLSQELSRNSNESITPYSPSHR